MTITELQKKLQVIYEKYGDVEVVVEDTDWANVENYYYRIFDVKKVKNKGSILIALSNYQ